MTTKAQRTTQYIIETVAPIFNKNGYVATSMSDITKATGLTKGAIYGNFKNKESLALKAFRFNLEMLTKKLEEKLAVSNSALQKLYIISNFYRHYDDYTREMGGCPILNIGIDANNHSEQLMLEVQNAINYIEKTIENIINNGKFSGELNPILDGSSYARRIFSMIQGAVFLSSCKNSNQYLKEIMSTIDAIIINELKKK